MRGNVTLPLRLALGVENRRGRLSVTRFRDGPNQAVHRDKSQTRQRHVVIVSVGETNRVANCWSARVAGPTITVPLVLYCEP